MDTHRRETKALQIKVKEALANRSSYKNFNKIQISYLGSWEKRMKDTWTNKLTIEGLKIRFRFYNFKLKISEFTIIDTKCKRRAIKIKSILWNKRSKLALPELVKVIFRLKKSKVHHNSWEWKLKKRGSLQWAQLPIRWILMKCWLRKENCARELTYSLLQWSYFRERLIEKKTYLN